MIRWRSAMRDIVSETRFRATSAQAEVRMHTLAVYGAFALIAAILFGTLSYHPF
jgi:hypothetical protein